MSTKPDAPDITAKKLQAMAASAYYAQAKDVLLQASGHITHLQRGVIDATHKIIELNQLKNPAPVMDTRLDALPCMQADIHSLANVVCESLSAQRAIVQSVTALASAIGVVQDTLQKLVTNNDLWGSIQTSVVGVKPLEPISNSETKPKMVKKAIKVKV